MSGTPHRWTAVGAPADVARRAPLVVDVGGLEVAVFHADGAFHALQNSCPHAGGPLAEGLVDGGAVECPWHGWTFELATGHCRAVPTRPARRFPLREVGGVLEVGVPADLLG